MNTDVYKPPQAPIADTDGYGTIEAFSFRGRLGRLRFIAYCFSTIPLAYVLFSVVLGLGAWLLDGGPAMLPGLAVGSGVIAVILNIIWAMWGAQRLRDMAVNGWAAVLLLVPLVNLIVFLVLVAVPGSSGANQYGLAPPPNSTAIGVMVAFGAIVLLAGVGLVLWAGYVMPDGY